jgi:16S rRNA A1518/A1519 N6-dimethyltransferase RsmA/KsgA/DIM1 with predicted DNA glycosylase/AP lyase activity
VLEIERGGTLTLALSRCAARVTAVEVDQSLAGVLVEAVGMRRTSSSFSKTS